MEIIPKIKIKGVAFMMSGILQNFLENVTPKARPLGRRLQEIVLCRDSLFNSVVGTDRYR